MSKISEYLERRSRASGFERALFTEDVTTLTSSIGLGSSNYYYAEKMESFFEWKGEFTKGYNSLLTDFKAKSLPKIDEIRKLISNGELEEAKKINSNFLRSLDNNYRWKFEQFFAIEGGEGAQAVLGYWGYEDGTSKFIRYTEEQIRELKETGKISIDGNPPEIHHINPVARGIEEPQRLGEIHHPDNGRIITGRRQVDNAHFYDPIKGHGGSYSNPTSGPSNEVSDRKNSILTHNRSDQENQINESLERFDASISVGAGVITGIITVVVQSYNLRNDPRPWKKKAALITVGGFVKAIEAGTLAMVALKSKKEIISNLGDSTAFEGFTSDLSIKLSEMLHNSIDFESDTFAMMIGSGASIAEVRIIKSAIVSLISLKSGNPIAVFKRFGKEVVIISIEETALISLALFIDFGLIFIDPSNHSGEPVYTFVRITYSAGKLSRNIYIQQKNRQKMSRYKEFQLDGLYETAITSLVLLG